APDDDRLILERRRARSVDDAHVRQRDGGLWNGHERTHRLGQRRERLRRKGDRRQQRHKGKRDLCHTAPFCKSTVDSRQSTVSQQSRSHQSRTVDGLLSTVDCRLHLTSNTIRIPASMCSAIWQCSIHLPGFDISTSTSTTKPVGTSTVSFHTRFSLGTPFDDRTRNR